MKLTKKYLEKLIKEECAAMLPLGGEEAIGMEDEGPPGAVDLPDDPNEAFGVGYSAALEEVIAAIEGLMPSVGGGPGEEEEGAAEVIAISGEAGFEEELEEGPTLGAASYPKRKDSKRRKKR